MSKQIYYGQDAKLKIKEGIDAVANAVKLTLGPKGQTVLIDSQYEEGRVTKDGVSVAKSIVLKDKVQDAGAKIIKKIASKTASDAGDGTTTATVLAQAMIDEGAKLLASGVNPMELKRGIDDAVAAVVKFLENSTKKVVDHKELQEIATVSANGDSEIGKLVADVISQVGPEGVISVETSKSTETYVEQVKGLRFDKGYISPYFITDTNKGISELDRPLILISSQKLTTAQQLQPFLEFAHSQGRSILFIADSVEGEALMCLLMNQARGTIKSCTVKCPSFGDRRTQELEDIAILTGGKVYDMNQISTSELLMDASKVDELLGNAEKVTVDAKNTTIVNGSGDKQEIANRIDFIRTLISNESSDYNKKGLQSRLAKLNNGVAVLNVGGTSEVEINEKKDRIDDALCAARAANEEGTTTGGGTTYLKAAVYLESTEPKGSASYACGYNLVKSTLSAPIIQIAENCNGDNGRVIEATLKAKYRESFDTDYGFNAATGEYENLRKSGVIDPTKVCRVAVTNAASIVGMYLTTGCIIVEEEDTKANPNL